MRHAFLPFLLLVSLFARPAQAAPYYYFGHFTTREGLPSNTIHCTYQDHFGFVWIGTRDGLTRFDGYDFRSPDPTEGGNDITSLATVDIAEDEDGLIWFSTSEGLGSYNPYTGKTERLGQLGTGNSYDLQPDGKGSIWFTGDKIYRYIKATGEVKAYPAGSSYPRKIAVDTNENVWAISVGGKLYNYNKRSDAFEETGLSLRLTNIEPAENGNLLASTTDQVLLIGTANLNLTVTEVFSTKSRGLEVREILERKPGEYWIGSSHGLFVQNLNTGELIEMHPQEADPHSLSANLVTSLKKDRQGNVWIGTYYTGINVWEDKQDTFMLFYPNPTPRSMIGSIVRSIVTDDDGNIWFCTEDGGLNFISASRGINESYVITPSLNMQQITASGDDLWIHTFGSGVYRYDRKRHVVKKHYSVSGANGCGLKTADGRIFTGGQRNLYVLDPELDQFVPVEPPCKEFVHCLFEDSRGNLWIGTYGDGFLCRDSSGNGLSHLTVQSDRGLTADRITSFFEDSRHRVWITTEGGGLCYTDPNPNLSNLRVHAYPRSEGFDNNVTCAVAEDEDGVLWVSTTRGIVRIDGETLDIQGYIEDRQQILGAQFSYGASLMTRSGYIFMGNTQGLAGFSPSKIKKAAMNNALYITDIEASNAERTIRLHEDGRSTIRTKRLSVKSRDASLLTISFATPDFSVIRQTTFAWTLKRNNRVFLSTPSTTENQVNFTGLRPGHYIFDVAIVGSENENARQTLDFNIEAPALWSRTAKTLYFILLLGLIALFFRELEMKRRRDRARHLSRMENQKQKEIYDAKINFFTNITHEIRTPLTLIKMPLDKLIEEKNYTPESEKDLLTIQANTDRLLSLTNQLLDLRRMEQNEIKPVFLKEDLCAIVRKSCRYFEQMAEEQKISLHEDIPDHSFEIMCARDSVEKIVSNLLSNAVKYTTDRIELSLKPSADGKTAILRVDSNGDKIPAKESEKIFEVFYQVGEERKSKGTGLGLAYARTLAALHSGRLYLDTSVENVNSFVLELPVEQQQQIRIEDRKQADDDSRNMDFDGSRHTLLIVEDSAEMRGYLAGELSDEYNIITAANGQDAVEKLQEERIDLVVSDIMMPLMDGCQLCNYIKTNMEFSHLPVLLLTAAVGMETRLQTLEVGADGYIEKPFPIALLRANISSLFKNRDIAYKQFTDSPLTHFNSVNTSKMDEEFMEKLHGIVMKHMAEQDLSIETLTSLIGTSKSTLYRKVKANTGLNINEYIRLCRLKQAAEMLSSQKYRVNEVAYMVGFSSPSYFATSFQKQFNISPSAFVKNLKD